MLIYDCEIIKAIRGKDEPVPGIEYCEGWHDHANMGISVICAYDYIDSRYRVFLKDGFGDFEDLAHARRPVAGFNSVAFDDKLCAANGMDIVTSYDLLIEMWRSAGLGETFVYPTHAGFSLDNTADRNLGRKKTGSGALAPVLWQQGQHGKVIDYCLEDIRLTKSLVDRVLTTGQLLDPRPPEYSQEAPLTMRRPQ